MLIHTVTKSDTLEGIAARYRISEAKLVEDNGLIPPYGIIEGQTLCIPHPSLFHTVYGGETEEGIALCYQTDIDTLKQLNPAFCREGALYPGQILTLPSKDRAPATVFGFMKEPLPLPSLLSLLPFLTFLVIPDSLREEYAARYAKEAAKRGVSSLYGGKECPEALCHLFDGLLFKEGEDLRLLLWENRENTRLCLSPSKQENARCLLSLDRPALHNGRVISASHLVSLLRALRRKGGALGRNGEGYACFLHTDPLHEEENGEVCFCDAEKEKAILEKNAQDDFHSFVIWDESEWGIQERLLFASLFSPVKLVKSQ